jgi:hypothetical protein
MTNILARIAAERSSFRPQTAQEFFALQLARKMNDLQSVHSYAALSETYPEEFLVSVCRNTLDGGREDMAARFRAELQRRVRKEGYAK